MKILPLGTQSSRIKRNVLKWIKTAIVRKCHRNQVGEAIKRSGSFSEKVMSGYNQWLISMVFPKWSSYHLSLLYEVKILIPEKYALYLEGYISHPSKRFLVYKQNKAERQSGRERNSCSNKYPGRYTLESINCPLLLSCLTLISFSGSLIYP